VRPKEKLLPEAALFDPAGDPAFLARLHAACFTKGWDAQSLRDLFAAGAFAFHNPDGFILARAAGGEAEILTLAVVPAARRKGVGRALVRAAANHSQALGAAALFLEVGVDNSAALALYAGLGFTKVGARKAYYDGIDAQLLRLSLPAKFA
jgi:ribosomal-protein-alanine N-acetyltransferase